MWSRVLGYGGIAGLIVGLPMIAMMLLWPDPDHGMQGGVVYGYTAMLVALTMVFLGVKAHRDKALGGVIKFLPALGVGLLISVVASVIYAFAWEVSLALTGFDFGAQYSQSMIEDYRAQGLPADELAKKIAEAESFAAMYRNPLMRIPMTMVEMLPVGLLVSLVSAALLRNDRFLPARRTASV